MKIKQVVFLSFLILCSLICYYLYQRLDKGFGSEIADQNYLSGYYVFDDEQIYFSAGYCLYQLEAETKTYKKFICTKGFTLNYPILYKGNIIVQAEDNVNDIRYLTMISMANKEILWNYRIPDGLYPNKAVNGDFLAFFSDRNLHIFYLPTRSFIWESEDSISDGIGQDQIALITKERNVLKLFNLPTPFDKNKVNPINIKNPDEILPEEIIMMNNDVIICKGKNEKGEIVFFAVNPKEDHNILWLKKYQYDYYFPPDNNTSLQKKSMNSLVFSKITSDDSEQLVSINTKNGNEDFKIDVHGMNSFANFKNREKINILAGNYNKILAYDFSQLSVFNSKDGKLLWEYQFYDDNREKLYSILETSDTLIYFITDKRIGAFDANNGKLIWEPYVDSNVRINMH
jgi:outer membrane protein assembly factor BamB